MFSIHYSSGGITEGVPALELAVVEAQKVLNNLGDSCRTAIIRKDGQDVQTVRLKFSVGDRVSHKFTRNLGYVQRVYDDSVTVEWDGQEGEFYSLDPSAVNKIPG